MPDLVHKLLHAELSEAEWDTLSRSVEASPELALRVAQEAEAAYLAYGLPQPGPGGGAGAGGWAQGGLSFKIVAVVTIGAASAGLAWMRHADEAPPLPVSAPVQAAAALPPARPGPLAPPRPALPVQPVRPSELSGELLSVHVVLDHSEMIRVRVVDAGGRELRRLYNGILKPGEWAFGWDSRLNDGSAAPKGAYEIIVDAGDSIRSKKVEIR